MKIIIAGSRNYKNYSEFSKIIKEDIEITDEIISGGAKGTDTMAINYALIHRHKLHKMPAEWEKYGKIAGCLRNKKMAQLGDKLIAFYNGSPGTKNMIHEMAALGKPVTIIEIGDKK